MLTGQKKAKQFQRIKAIGHTPYKDPTIHGMGKPYKARSQASVNAGEDRGSYTGGLWCSAMVAWCYVCLDLCMAAMAQCVSGSSIMCMDPAMPQWYVVV